MRVEWKDIPKKGCTRRRRNCAPYHCCGSLQNGRAISGSFYGNASVSTANFAKSPLVRKSQSSTPSTAIAQVPANPNAGGSLREDVQVALKIGAPDHWCVSLICDIAP